MRKLYLSCLFLAVCTLLHSQYSDFVGAGNTQGITVNSSDPSSNASFTLDGSGLNHNLQAASRFLARATLGATIEEIRSVEQIGFEAWIDAQLNMPIENYAEETINNALFLYDQCLENLGEDQCNQVFMLNTQMFRYAWWNKVMNSQDKLRHKVALALSEILVLSDNSNLRNFPHGIGAYYDILNRHAFGNYKDLLLDVTLNPSMGFYLSHINNPRTIEELNIHPDENYAREIMQLFSIGLYELNQDGSRKIDPTTGLWIPTYDNNDIKGLAKVFTGLSGGAWADENDNRPVQFGRNFGRYSLLVPMQMFEEWHEPGPKTIVGGKVIESDSGLEEIEMAVDHLFNHENVGPFISYRLIQRLVKSNPTPEYVERISAVFNDNGEGERGDLESVVKAILLDPEAMDCYWFGDMENGQLRPPIQRLCQMLIGLKANAESDVFWNSGFFFQEFTAQHPMSSPTVFNFYKPDYIPDSDFAYYELSGPEYEILNSSTSSNYVNFMLIALLRDYLLDRYGIRLPNVLNEAFLIPYVEDNDFYAAELQDALWIELGYTPSHLVDYLDLLLANGMFTDETRDKLNESLSRDNILQPIDKSNYALFMTMIHPDYIIMK